MTNKVHMIHIRTKIEMHYINDDLQWENWKVVFLKLFIYIIMYIKPLKGSPIFLNHSSTQPFKTFHQFNLKFKNFITKFYNLPNISIFKIILKTLWILIVCDTLSISQCAHLNKCHHCWSQTLKLTSSTQGYGGESY